MLERFLAVGTRERVDHDYRTGTIVHLDFARLSRIFFDVDEWFAGRAGGPPADTRREHGMGRIGGRVRTGKAGGDLARR